MRLYQFLIRGGREVWTNLFSIIYFILASSQALALPVSKPSPIIGPDVISFGSLQPVTIIYHPLAIVQPQIGLPAPEGSVFEGPDPGLNANIIGGTDCPNNYRKDRSGICRLEFVYGPHPFSAIIPKTFKGSLQFYMGFQVGNYNPLPRRRGNSRLRGRTRNRNGARRGRQKVIQNEDRVRQKEEKDTQKEDTARQKEEKDTQKEERVRQTDDKDQDKKVEKEKEQQKQIEKQQIDQQQKLKQSNSDDDDD